MKLVILLLVSLSCWGQGSVEVRAELTRHRISVHDWSLIAGSVGVGMDAVSSWGKPEATALYRGGLGRFRTRGAVFRLGIWGTSAAIQKVVCRKERKRKRACKIATVINFAVAGSGVSVSIHNWSL